MHENLLKMMRKKAWDVLYSILKQFWQRMVAVSLKNQFLRKLSCGQSVGTVPLLKSGTIKSFQEELTILAWFSSLLGYVSQEIIDLFSTQMFRYQNSDFQLLQMKKHLSFAVWTKHVVSLVTCGEAQVIEWQELLFLFLLGFTFCRESSQNLIKSSSNLSKKDMKGL